MFCPLAYRENIMILRGVLVLVIVIMLGVVVTEQQLSSLTQRQESMGTFNITCDKSRTYSIYLLESNYKVRACYSLGEIGIQDKNIVLKTGVHSVSIPTYIQFDCKKELILLELWTRLLVEDAFKFKQTFELYIATISHRMNVYIRQVR